MRASRLLQRWRAAQPRQRVLLLLTAWVLTRLALLAGTRVRSLYPYQDDPFDLAGFGGWGRAFTGGDGAVPLRDGPWEYPFGAAPVVALPALLDAVPYVVGFVGLMTLADAGVLALLVRVGLRSGGSLAGAAWWVAAVPLLGPVALGRFDVVPTLLAVGGLTAAGPVAAGALLATGGVVKLWPALLVPLVALRGQPLRVLAAAAAAGAAALAAAATVFGPAHLLSFLAYQDERGLEIESVPALPLLLGRVLADRPAGVSFGFGSYQVSGPGEPLLRAAADAAVPLVVVGVLLLAVRARRAGRSREATPLLGVLLLAAVLLVDKVLSAQYPLWLAGVTAAALVVPGSPLRRDLPLLAGVLLLTGAVYPLLIQDLLRVEPLPVLLLTARDLLLLVLTARLARRSWRAGSRRA